MRIVMLRLVALLMLVGAPAMAQTDYSAPGPFAIAMSDTEWTDEARARTLPIRIRMPEGAPGQRPVLVFSHGLGGSIRAAEYLAEHMVSHGWVVINLQHPGSDESIIGEGDFFGFGNLENSILRHEDVFFVVDQIEARAPDGPVLGGRIDPARIAMSGHSFGAVTTNYAAGQQYARQVEPASWKEPRFKAAVALSPDLPTVLFATDYLTSYRDITMPILHVTGTEDDANNIGPERRIPPFQFIMHAPRYQLVLDGADHDVLSGRSRGAPQPKDEIHYRMIRALVLAFLEGHVNGDAAALGYLRGGGYVGFLGDEGDYRFAEPVSAEMTGPETGWWWNPLEPGWGMALEERGGNLFAAVYNYGEDGAAVWRIALGAMTGPQLFENDWQRYRDGPTLDGPGEGFRQTGPDGSVTLVFESPASGIVSLPDGSRVPIVRFIF